jgi:MFS family permease
MRELEFDLKTSAQIASVMGLSTFLGRVGVGFLVDRIFAPYVAMAFFGCSAVGFLLISGGISSNTAYLAALLLGLGFGAESDLIGYFVSRYFGLKNFGEIYGYIYGAFLIGAGAGPLLLGFGYDYFNGYQGLLRLFGIVCAFSCFLFLLLPPFPTLATSQTSLDKPTHSSVSVN